MLVYGEAGKYRTEIQRGGDAASARYSLRAGSSMTEGQTPLRGPVLYWTVAHESNSNGG